MGEFLTCESGAGADARPADVHYAKVVEANRRYYARTAALYDETETCVTERYAQQMLEDDLDRVLELLGRPVHAVDALDACGGSGNVSLKLARRGVRVTLVDISPELIDRFQRKVDSSASQVTCVIMEAGDFLVAHRSAYDLIVFSSALHHIENVQEILHKAVAALKPGGLVFTIFDPVSRSEQTTLTRIVLRLDYFAFKILEQSGDLAAAVRRRWRRSVFGQSGRGKERIDRTALTALADLTDLNEDTYGVIAEYHGYAGIDDHAVVATMRTSGCEVIWHDRYGNARYPLFRWIVKRLGDATSFKLLLRRPG